MIDRGALKMATVRFREALYDPDHINPVDDCISCAITAYMDAMRAKGWKMMPREATAEMTEAAARDAGEWCEPYTAPRESGVAVDGDISQEDADYFNAEAMTTCANRWRVMFDAHTSDTQERE